MAFTDTFNRASLGATWETVLGTAWAIASSLYLKPVNQYAQTAVRVVGTFPNNQHATVWTEIVTGAGDVTDGGPAVRIDASGNCYYLLLGPGTITLRKRVAGTTSYLADVAFSPTPGTLYQLDLVVTGTLLEVFKGGVSQFTHTDASLAAGNPGCYANTGQTSLFPRFDDFECTDAGSGASVVPGAMASDRRRRAA